jgi:phosphoenolpyruvate carboxykinase (ATP)
MKSSNIYEFSDILVDTGLNFEGMVTLRAEADRHLGYESRYVWDVSINGIKIQLRTNNPEIMDLWRDNWYPAPMGHEGVHPHGVVYAITGMKHTDPLCAYHPESKTAFAFNIDFYGKIRSLALGVVMDFVESRREIHFIRGSLVELAGEGIAFLSRTDGGRTTHTFLLLQMDEARIHSHEWIYAEHLGGEKGRISTHSSERSFFLRSDVIQINPRLSELINRCKRHGDFFLLDPLWIGGQTKAVDTTRIKVAFLLLDDGHKQAVVRLEPEEALDLMVNNPEPFFNPHMVVRTPERIHMEREFMKELLEFVPVYRVNTSLPLLDVHARIRDIITSRHYAKKPGPKPLSLITEKRIEVKMPKLDLFAIQKWVGRIKDQLNTEHYNPQVVRRMAEKFGSKTKFGNYNFVSTVKNRSAGLTIVAGSDRVLQRNLSTRQRELISNLPRTMKELEAYIEKSPFICVERAMGGNSEFAPRCTMYQSVHREEMVRLAYMVGQTLMPRDESKGGPHLNLVYIPEWHEKDRQIIVFPEIGTTFVLGTDYYGEAKKGFLRMAMWEVKQRGMLGLHAGAKTIKARDKEGRLKHYGMLIFGLTATGKTTHTCHHHGLVGNGQGIKIVQDDVVMLRKDGSVLGTERGFYVKTDSLNPEIQPILYNAATRPDAIFENVLVDYRGEVDFQDEILTANGRCIIQKDDLGEYMAGTLNLPQVSELDGLIIAFITRRNTIIPIASKLTPIQAAAAFMLGESVETSGSDPRRAGESVREVGTNPFIIGDPAQEGNIFLDIIMGLGDKVQCYLLNTGGIGEVRETAPDGSKLLKRPVKRVEIPEMASVIRAIVTNSAEWKEDPYFGTMVLKKIPGMGIRKYNPRIFYSDVEIKEMVEDLRNERREYLSQFEGLDPKIKEAV